MVHESKNLGQKQYIDASEAVSYSQEKGWTHLDPKEKTLTFEGRQYKVIDKKERHLSPFSLEGIGRIALGLLCVIPTLGLALLSKTIKQLFTGRQVVSFVKPEEEIQDKKKNNVDTESPAFYPQEQKNEVFFGFKVIPGFKPKIDRGYIMAENTVTFTLSVKNAKAELARICREKRPEEISNLPMKKELLELNAQEYKIHLMPKKEKMNEVLARLVAKFENDPELKGHVVQYKALVGQKIDTEKRPDPFTDKDKGSDEYYPRIVIYTESKTAGEAVLNAVYSLFKDDAEELGDKDFSPRYNKQINSLVYYAQGSGSIKNAAKEAGVADQLFEKDLVHMKGKAPGAHALKLHQ